jgi:hypothetical protein
MSSIVQLTANRGVMTGRTSKLRLFVPGSFIFSWMYWITSSVAVMDSLVF